MHSGTSWRLGRRPGLDGLRGVAILLVLSAHTWNLGLDDGAVGVTVFFALSGFLITALLLDESERTGRVSFRRFYLRRARRLLPALFAYLAVWSALTVAGWNVLGLTAREVLDVLLYITNWVMASGKEVSHVVAITWSLAIEEQFYLLWPLTFLLAHRWPRLPAITAVFGIVVAVAIRFTVWGVPDAEWPIYHRTDTRMDSLLLGCLLAIALKRYGVPNWGRRAVWPGVAVLAMVLVCRIDAVSYLATPLVASAAACALIVGILAGGARWLENPTLRWFGRRSYALYLWHYPLAALAWAGVWPTWVAVLLALVAAELSWWLVERPFSRRRSRHPEEVEVRVRGGAAVVAGH